MKFYDTYALVEMFLGNKNFEVYFDEEWCTSILNLGELYYALLRLGSGHSFHNFKPRVVDFDLSIITEAMELKFKHKKMKLSLVDCVGYVLSLRIGAPFVTGDRQFNGMPNVEFVK